MNGIVTLLRLAGRRIGLSALMHGIAVALAVAAGVVLLGVLISRGVPALDLSWWPIGLAVAAVALVAGAVAWRRARRDTLELALMVDERLGLKERLSTAISCGQRDDPFAQAAVEDAVTVAADPALPDRVKRAFPVQAPGLWWVGPALLAVAVGTTFLPQRDLFARETVVDPGLDPTREVARTSMQAVIDEIEENDALSEEMSDLLAELQAEQFDGESLRSEEDIRREAIKQATELSERLTELLGGEKAMELKAMREGLRQLEAPESGAAKEFAEAMAKGDMKAAQQALQQILDQAQNGDMPEDQKAQLADQLQQLGDQMEKLAQQQDALKDALQKAGLDPQLANNMQALQQAMQNNPNLNEQQKQQLQQMAQAQQNAQGQMQQLAQAMQGMAQAMAQGDPQQLAQMGENAQGMLNQAEMMQQMLQQAQAAMNQCQGQCQGMGQGLGQKAGSSGAFGGPGQGQGGNAPISPTPTGTKLRKEQAEIVGGDIIARQLVEGEPITGESRARLERVVSELAQGRESGNADERVPPHLREVHKHYFGELRKRLRDAPTEEDDR